MQEVNCQLCGSKGGCGAACAQDTFRIGIFSSASQRTVDTVVPLLEAAAREGQQLTSPDGVGWRRPPRLLQQKLFVLSRTYTDAAPQVWLL